MKHVRLVEFLVLAYGRKDLFVGQQMEVAAKSQIGL